MQTGRMPAASLFQSLASSSRNEAVAKIQAARSAEKKNKRTKKKQSRRGRGRGASATPAPEPTGEGEENQAEPGTENPAKRPGEEALADEPNFSEKTGLEEVQQAEKAKQMQPMMQAAAVALARERNWLASAMIHHFIEPLALEHRDNVKTLREGQQATVSLYHKLALGFRHRASFQILTRLLDPQCLSECGFVIDISLARHENALPSDPAVLEQDALASRVDTMVLHLLRQRSVGATQFSDSVLGIIGTFAAPSNTEQRKVALEKLRNIKYTIDRAKAQRSPLIKKWVQRSETSKIVEKRILGFCQDVGFDTWPEAAQQEVDHIFKAEPSTLIVENAFKELRSAERGGLVK